MPTVTSLRSVSFGFNCQTFDNGLGVKPNVRILEENALSRVIYVNN